VTLSIAVAPSASVTVAITLQYDSPEAAAAGASAVELAITDGAMAHALAVLAPMLSLDAVTLPELLLPSPPPAPAAAAPAPLAAPPPPPSPAAAAAAVLRRDDDRRTAAIAVSLTVGVVIILLGAALTALWRASASRRVGGDASSYADADALSLIDKHAPYARSWTRLRDSSSISVAHDTGVRRASSLLGVVVNADAELVCDLDMQRSAALMQLQQQEEAAAAPPAMPSSAWGMRPAHVSAVTPPMTRAQLLSALVGTEVNSDDTPPAPMSSLTRAQLHRQQSQRTPRAAATLGDDGNDGAAAALEEDAQHHAAAALPMRPSLPRHTSSGGKSGVRARRGSVTK
jgi:hypothetical protein